MNEQIIRYLIPLVLLVSAAWLGTQEIYHFRSQPASYPKMRLARRLLGALCLGTIAVMVYYGDLSIISMTPAERKNSFLATDHQAAINCLNYWSTVMGLVLAAIILALWDVISGLRMIKRMMEDSNHKDLQILREQIERLKTEGKNNHKNTKIPSSKSAITHEKKENEND